MRKTERREGGNDATPILIEVGGNDAVMRSGGAGGTQESGSEAKVTVNAITSTVPLMWDQLRALEKPRLNSNEVMVQFTTLVQRAGLVMMAFCCHGVVDISAEE